MGIFEIGNHKDLNLSIHMGHNKDTALNEEQFNRRAEARRVSQHLFDLYTHNKESISKYKSRYSIEDIDEILTHLTDCKQLSSARAYIKDPSDDNAYNVFLDRLDYLEQVAVKAEYCWSKRKTIVVSQFIRSYKNLLNALCKQKIELQQISLKTREFMQEPQTQPNEKAKIDKKTKLLQALANIDFYCEQVRKIKKCDL